MSVIIIAKNVTSGPPVDVTIDDLGAKVIPASGQVNLTDNYYFVDIQNSDDLISAINDDKIIINDGTSDLSKQGSLNILSSGSSSELQGTKVDSTTPTSDQVLQYDTGSSSWKAKDVIFGSEYKYAASEGQSSTTSETYQQKLSLSTGSIPAGDYKISWSFCWNVQGGAQYKHKSRVQIDDTTTIMEQATEAYENDINERNYTSGFKKATLTAATHTIDLDWAMENGSDTAFIREARLEIFRVS